MSQDFRISAEGCDHGGFTNIGQTVVSDRLRWYRSMSCSNCGNVEVDGIGFPPEDIRQIIIGNGGYWSVSVERPNLIAALKLLKEELGLSNKDVSSQIKKYPIIFQGTLTEAEWIKSKLVKVSIKSEVTENKL